MEHLNSKLWGCTFNIFIHVFKFLEHFDTNCCTFNHSSFLLLWSLCCSIHLTSLNRGLFLLFPPFCFCFCFFFAPVVVVLFNSPDKLEPRFVPSFSSLLLLLLLLSIGEVDVANVWHNPNWLLVNTHPPADEGRCLKQCTWACEGEGKPSKNTSNKADCAGGQSLVDKHIPPIFS